MQVIDQRAAIMIVIEHLGNIEPGTRCSAVFFDSERIRREQDFRARLFSENGVFDSDGDRELASASVPDQPFWLVALKTGDSTTGEQTQLHRVDAATGTLLPSVN